MAARGLRSNSTAPEIWPIGRAEAIDPNANNAGGAGQAPPPPPPNQPPNPPPPPPPVIMANATPEVWKSNPLQGDFNPGTKLGKDIFLEKSKGLPEADRFDLTQENAGEIHRYLRARENQMEDSMAIPTEFNADGTVKTTKDLLTQYHSITLEDVQRAAFERYGTKLAATDAIPAPPFDAKNLDPANSADDKKQFYRKVHANVVAKIVQNGISVSSYEDLLLRKEDFQFQNPTTSEIEFDGPTMIFIIFTLIDPSTVVGLDSIEEQLTDAKLGDFSNDVSSMLTFMQTNYKTLKLNGQAPKKFRKILIAALKTGPNHTFNTFVQRIEDETESGIGAMANLTSDQVITACRAKYNNMVSKKEWTAVDPREAQILALATQMKEMQAKHSQALATFDKRSASGPAPPARTGRKDGLDVGDEYIDGIPKWRTINKGPTLTRGGTTFFWCPHHHHSKGLWNGLYCVHRPENHVFRRRKTTKEGEQNSNGTAGAAANATAEKATLDLTSRLKEVLATNLCMAEEDVDKLFEQASASN